MSIIYLTGCSTELSRQSERADIGLLATPASYVYGQRQHYPVWAADNALFTAPKQTAHQVRYDLDPAQLKKWRTWLEAADPAGCLFATLPDVPGDMQATWQRSACVSWVRHLWKTYRSRTG